MINQNQIMFLPRLLSNSCFLIYRQNMDWNLFLLNGQLQLSQISKFISKKIQK